MQQNPDLTDPAAWLDETRHPRFARTALWFSSRTDLDMADLRNYLGKNFQG